MLRSLPLLLPFALGSLCTFGIQTSTFVQALFAQNTPPTCPKPPTLPIEVTRTFGMTLIKVDGAKPGVPEIMIPLGGNNSGAIQQFRWFGLRRLHFESQPTDVCRRTIQMHELLDIFGARNILGGGRAKHPSSVTTRGRDTGSTPSESRSSESEYSTSNDNGTNEA
jgi:hypothetical protein